MSEQELAEFQRFVAETLKDRTSNVEVARKVLLEEGVITPDGKLTEKFGGQKAA